MGFWMKCCSFISLTSLKWSRLALLIILRKLKRGYITAINKLMLSESLLKELKGILQEEDRLEISEVETAKIGQDLVDYFDLLNRVDQRNNKYKIYE